jgi:putative hydrolase of the HAD superfamily
MPFTTILYDLDATLYPASSGLWEEIKHRITAYLQTRLGLDAAAALTLQQHYLQTFGTTLRGLQNEYHIDTDAYFEFVHNIPLHDHLQPDLPLRAMLRRANLSQWIFTNSDRAHAERVLEALGIPDCFDGLITIETMRYACKPNRSAYQTALEITGEPDPRSVVFLDDSARNLRAARDLGMHTVLVGQTKPDPSACHSILFPHELPDILPGVFRSPDGN